MPRLRLVKRLKQAEISLLYGRDADGSVRGLTLEPLHKAAPKAARQDPMLYELLALIDALRDGRVRERHIAERELTARLRRLLRG